MKKRIQKYAWPIVIVLIAGLLLVLWISSLNDWKSDYRDREYTPFCTNDNGFSYLLEAVQTAAERHGMRADVFCKSARFLPDRSMAVISLTASQWQYPVEDITELRTQLEDGLVLVYLADVRDSAYLNPDSAFSILPPELLPREGLETRSLGTCSVGIAAVGKGRTVCIGCESQLLNGSLHLDDTAGAEVLSFLISFAEECGCRDILFDEYYAGIRRSETWDTLGGWFVLGLAELGLAVAAFLLWKSRRFGAPKDLTEAERRSETEALEATARLYRKAGAGSIGFCIRAEEILLDLGKVNGLASHWDPEDIARELASGKVSPDPDVIALSGAYLEARKKEIGEGRAKQLTALADRIRKKLKEDTV